MWLCLPAKDLGSNLGFKLLTRVQRSSKWIGFIWRTLDSKKEDMQGLSYKIFKTLRNNIFFKDISFYLVVGNLQIKCTHIPNLQINQKLFDWILFKQPDGFSKNWGNIYGIEFFID